MKIDSKRATWSSRTAVVVAAMLLAAVPSVARAQSGDRWVGTWTASPVAPFGESAPANLRDPHFENQTVRDVVHTSIGGSKVAYVPSASSFTLRVTVLWPTIARVGGALPGTAPS